MEDLVKLPNYNLKISEHFEAFPELWSEPISLIQSINILDFYYCIKK